jgi:hypothetical protein
MRRAAAVVLTLGLALVLAYSWRARTKTGTSGASGHGRQIVRSEMSAAEIKYGMAPTPDPAITYQPDVPVLVRARQL